MTFKRLLFSLSLLAAAVAARAQSTGWKFTKCAELHVFLDANGTTHVSKDDPYPETNKTYYRQYVTYLPITDTNISSYMGSETTEWNGQSRANLYTVTLSDGVITAANKLNDWDGYNAVNTYYEKCEASDAGALLFGDDYYKPANISDYTSVYRQAYSNIYVAHTDGDGNTTYTREAKSQGKLYTDAGTTYYYENPTRSYDLFSTFLTDHNVSVQGHFDRMGYIITTSTAEINLDDDDWWEDTSLTDKEHLKISGTLTAEDVTHLQALTSAHHFLMQDCTDPNHLAASVFANNTTVTDIILPPSYAQEKIDPAPFAGCTALGSVVAVDFTEVDNDDGTTTKSADHLSCYAFKQDGSLWTSTASEAHFPEIWDTQNHKISVKHIIAGGDLMLADIHATDPSTGQPKANEMIAENLETLDLSAATYHVTGGEESLSNYKLFNLSGETTLKRLSLPEGITTLDTDLWGQNGLSSLEYVRIPASVETIGENTFNGCSNLTTVEYAPGSKLTTIGNNAFKGTHLNSITFPDNVETIGESAYDGLKTSDGKNAHFASIVFPSHLREIGNMAFPNMSFDDIYFTGLTAPTIHGTPFTVDEQKGGGYMDLEHVQVLDKDGNYKEKYAKDYYSGFGAGSESLPNYSTDVEAQAFASAATAGDRLIADPSMYRRESGGFASVLHLNPRLFETEEGRAELANFTDTTRNYSLVDRYYGDSRKWPTQNQMKAAYNAASNGKNWDGTTYDEAYKQLHCFVLVFYDSPDNSTEIDLPKFQDGLWWSICLPCDLSKKQVLEAFGDQTRVCEFNKVVREVNDDESCLELHFQHEICQFKMVDDVRQDVGDDDRVIVANTPYMIHPQTGTVRPQDYAGPKIFVSGSILGGGEIPWPIVSETKAGDKTNGVTYTFYGNLTKDYGPGSNRRFFPKNSYFVYYHDTAPDDWNTTHPGETFEEWHDMAFCQWADLVCGQYSAFVQLKEADGKADRDTFFPDPASGAAKRKITFGHAFGDDESATTTGVEKVTIICGEDNPEVAATYYTLDGRRLSGTPSRKGIYISNGHKYAIK